MIDYLMLAAATGGLAVMHSTCWMVCGRMLARIWFNADNSPRRCTFCHSREFDEMVKATEAYVISETEWRCKECRTSAGYWAHGSFDPAAQNCFKAAADRIACEVGAAGAIVTGVVLLCSN